MQLILGLLCIIGILILAVLLLVLLVVLLVLICPVRYKVIVTRELTSSPEVNARVTWLLRLLSVRVDYREKLSYSVKLFGYTLLKGDDVLSSKETSSEKDEDAGEAVQSAEGHAAETNRASNAELSPVSEEKSSSQVKSEPEDEAFSEKESVPFGEKIGKAFQHIAGLLNEIQGTIPEKIAEILEKIAGWIEKISEYPDMILDKIDELQKKKDKLLRQINDVQNQSAVKAVFGTTGSLLMHIKPQKLKIEGRLGFDDPAMTGQIFGLIGMLMPLYGETIHLEAVFNEAVAEGKLEAKGRIRIGTALYMALRLIGKKDVRRLIAQVKRLKKA